MKIIGFPSRLYRRGSVWLAYMRFRIYIGLGRIKTWVGYKIIVNQAKFVSNPPSSRTPPKVLLVSDLPLLNIRINRGFFSRLKKWTFNKKKVLLDGRNYSKVLYFYQWNTEKLNLKVICFFLMAKYIYIYK